MATNSFAIDNFNRNISSVEDLLKIYNIISNDYPILHEQSDEILRASIVLTVSALDNFLHDYYRTEIVESFLGKGNFNIKFDKIQITVKGLLELNDTFSEGEKRNFLNNELRKMQKTDSYQSQRSIENLFSNLGINSIWTRLESIINIKAKNIQKELSIIIDRRNKISHESDWDYVNQQKNPIDKSQVEEVLEFIKKMVVGINNILPTATN